MQQFTIDGDVQFSKKHFNNIEELILEISVIHKPVFERKDYVVPDHHKKLLDKLIKEAEEDGYKKGYSLAEFKARF